MKLYEISKTGYRTDTSPEMGHGDYGRRTYRKLGTVTADTRREAYSKAKRKWPDECLRFSGMNGDVCDELPRFKPRVCQSCGRHLLNPGYGKTMAKCCGEYQRWFERA